MGKNYKKKINLFFCINGLQKGGAEKQLNYISNYLCSKYKIHIFTLDKNKISYKFNTKINIHKYTGVFFFINFLLKIFEYKPKIIFFMLPKSYFYFGTLAIFFPKIKKILLRRSLNYYHKNLFFKYYEIFLHRFINLFICNSISSKKNISKTEFVKNNKVIVINNYIEFLPQSIKSINKENNFKILCIANFYKYKGHFLLIKSLSYIKKLNWKVYFYGEERNLTKQEVINYSIKNGIRNKVSFVKNLNSSFKFPYFKLGILLSKTESFPNAVLEYLSLNLPVIASAVGDIKYLVNEENGKIVKSRNPEIISKLIKKILFNKNLKTKSINSGKKIKYYTSKLNTLEKYNKVIKKVICAEF